MRYLFFDDHEVEARAGLTRTVHAATKFPGNPILVPEPPWEGAMVPSTVLYDDADGLFKMWYQTHARVPGADSTYVACHATSRDGVHWERPDVGAYEYEGSTRNNLCLVNSPGGMGVIKDGREPDPARRFKALFWRGGNRSAADVARGWGANEVRGFHAAFSPDGMRWALHPDTPVLTGTGDTESLFGWDERYGAYVAYVRPGRGQAAGEAVPRRVIGRSTSDDFLRWSAPVAVVVPDADDPPLAEHYFMPVHAYHGHYVAIVHVFVPSPDPFGPFWPELAHSRDGIRWRRLRGDARGHALDLVVNTEEAPTAGWPRLIWPGAPGSFDCGMIRCARGMFERGDELWLYYGGWREDHGASRRHRHMDTPREAQRRAAAIGLATLRLDGFVSLDAGDAEGTLLTAPLPCAGAALTLNARVTRPGGYVAAAVLDTSGHPIGGREQAACDAFSGDGVRHALTWNGRSDLTRLRGMSIKVCLALRHAELYSLTV